MQLSAYPQFKDMDYVENFVCWATHDLCNSYPTKHLDKHFHLLNQDGNIAGVIEQLTIPRHGLPGKNFFVVYIYCYFTGKVKESFKSCTKNALPWVFEGLFVEKPHGAQQGKRNFSTKILKKPEVRCFFIKVLSSILVSFPVKKQHAFLSHFESNN